eukprot:sb/3476393/
MKKLKKVETTTCEACGMEDETIKHGGFIRDLVWHQLPKSPWAEAVGNIPATSPRTGNGSSMAPTPYWLVLRTSQRPLRRRRRSLQTEYRERILGLPGRVRAHRENTEKGSSLRSIIG